MKYLRVLLAVLANSGIMLYAEPSSEFTALLEKASTGDAEAQYTVSRAYAKGSEGYGVKKDLKKASKWLSFRRETIGYIWEFWDEHELWRYSPKFAALKEKASAGDAESQFDVGWAYENGDSVKKDAEQAFKWYLKAAEQGYIDAQCSIAWAYKNGSGVKRDAKQAFEWNLKAAEQEDGRAQYNVGEAYARGEGVEKDLIKAAKWISKVNIDEVPWAIKLWETYKLEKYYMCSPRFIDMKEKASAGDAEAQYNVGLSYDHGNGVKKNPKKAFKWYLKAAEQGHVKAQFEVGESYNGDGDYSEDDGYAFLGFFGSYGNTHTDFYWRNSEKAFKWYLKAAEQGHIEAQYNVAVFYEYAEGVEQDLQKAFGWYQKAATQGHAQAQYDLAWAYENGRGVKKDLKKAFQWHLKAAEQGYEDALHKVGEAYFIGKGVEKDAKQSFKWYLKASWEGKKKARVEEAKKFTSRAYDLVKHSEKDPKKLFVWYLEAAELEEYGGYREAQYDVGVSYANGEGVEQDPQKAFKWCLKATETMYGEVNPKAQLSVGSFYAEGEGIKKDLKKAAEWICLVNKDDVPEAVELWEKYELEQYHKPFPDLTALIAKAFAGDRETQYEVGKLYEKGDSIEKDAKKAFEWYLKAAKQGYTKAQYEVGKAYIRGEEVEKDLKKAARWISLLDENDVPQVVELWKEHSLWEYSELSLEFIENRERVYAGSTEDLLLIRSVDNEYRRSKRSSKAAFEGYKGKLGDLAWSTVYVGRRYHGCHYYISLGDAYLKGEEVELDPKKAFGMYIEGEQETGKDGQYEMADLHVERSYDLARRVSKDPKKAFEWYLKADEIRFYGGYTKAQYDIGKSYADGYGVEQDFEKAFEWYLKAVTQRGSEPDVRAQYAIGRAYAKGEGVEKDLIKASQWISLVRGAELPKAVRLWEEYELEKYYEHSLEFTALLEGAITGNGWDQYELSQLYNKGVRANPTKAFEWCLKAAEQGHLEAQYKVGIAYAQGEGVTRDSKKAFEWYLKAAEKENIYARYSVATAYARGEGVGKDLEKAAQWISPLKGEYDSYENSNLWEEYELWKYTPEFIALKEKASHGDPSSQYEVGIRYDGNDTKKAFEWYLKAAEQEHKSALLHVGKAYSNGEGVEQDVKKAFEWYLKAAEQGSVVAKNYIGNAYSNGKGVAKDPEKAFEWYIKAAEQGDAIAKNDIGRAYANGVGVTQDSKKAFEWYLKAAKQGLASAQYIVGRAYANGDRVEKDLEKAFEWYLKAAELNYEPAKFYLGRAYFIGEGVQKDPEKATKWIKVGPGNILIKRSF